MLAAPEGVLAVLRVQGDEQVLYVANPGGTPARFEHPALKGAKLLDGGHLATLADSLELGPYGRAFLAAG